MTKIPDPRGALKNPIPQEEWLFKCSTCLDFFKWPDKRGDQCKHCSNKERHMDKYDVGDSGDEN